jgi:hypothetical protein
MWVIRAKFRIRKSRIKTPRLQIKYLSRHTSACKSLLCSHNAPPNPHGKYANLAYSSVVYLDKNIRCRVVVAGASVVRYYSRGLGRTWMSRDLKSSSEL